MPQGSTADTASFFPKRSRGVTIRISPSKREFLIFSLWCGVTFTQFSGDELLLYPLALYYAWAIWRDQTKIAPLLARAWVVLLFPAWCLMTPMWAIAPGEALKNAIYLILTIMICFHVAATMRPRQILHALLLASGVIAVINTAVAINTGNFSTGMFIQKNFMGKTMVILWVIASAVLLDRGSAWWLRVLAAVLAANSAIMSVYSQSATAVLLVLATGMLNLAGAIFLLGGVLRASRLAALCFFVAGTSAAGMLVLPGLQSSPAEAVLAHFGKDTTLTGRTVLWEYAEDEIAEHPYLGVGHGGFWQYNASPLVQKIHEDFHRGSNANFNFHNAYYEIAVHQGLIGLSFAVAALIWALFQVARGAVVIATLPFIYFFTHGVTVLARTMTESDFLRPFTLFHMILWIGALATTKALMQRPSQKENASQ